MALELRKAHYIGSRLVGSVHRNGRITEKRFFAIGRADITDMLSNTLGGISGTGIYTLLARVPKDRTNKVMNVLAAALTVMATLIVALLLINHRWVRIK